MEGDVFAALTNNLSRFSIDDLPVAAHPSPALGRKFNSPPAKFPPEVFRPADDKGDINEIYDQ